MTDTPKPLNVGGDFVTGGKREIDTGGGAYAACATASQLMGGRVSKAGRASR